MNYLLNKIMCEISHLSKNSFSRIKRVESIQIQNPILQTVTSLIDKLSTTLIKHWRMLKTYFTIPALGNILNVHIYLCPNDPSCFCVYALDFSSYILLFKKYITVLCNNHSQTFAKRDCLATIIVLNVFWIRDIRRYDSILQNIK